MSPVCVVCACPANVYCHNDDANLCFGCDHIVHSAHAVAASHRRTPIGDCVPQTDRKSEDANADDLFAVPQELPPIGKTERLDNMDLSFSDDGWFTVPDTACSTARAAIRSKKAKSFEIDDLFGFDAALDDDVVFALDPTSTADMLSDCVVPDDELEPPRELAQPRASGFTDDLDQTPDVPEQEQTYRQAAPAPAPVSRAPTSTAPPPAIAFTYPPISDTVPNFDNYVPISLLPVDAVSRGMALAERRGKVQRFREKKKNRQFKKLIRYASRKRYAEVRPRIKGRFARKDEIAAAKAAGIPLEC